MTPIHLKERAVLAVAGAEAADFLQSLVTNDIAALPDDAACWAALLTPQGKILFDFFIHRAAPDRFLLDVSAAQRDQLAQRMGMYVLRRDVAITPRDDLAVAAGDVEGAQAVFADPRRPDFGRRAIIDAEQAAALPDDAADYHRRRIALGLPDTDADIRSGDIFPHEANMDQLGGVSFTKGCYVGQEVVSRMRHKTTVRKRLVPVSADAPLTSGVDVTAGGRRIGDVRSVAGRRAIALIRLDRAAAGDTLLAGEVPVTLVRPDWATFAVPGA
ncbi:MAG TPA: folate-binding protein [Thermopetrobacter sp.]|nr:folate-binding protein [Thermopetrobacter sp.]